MLRAVASICVERVASDKTSQVARFLWNVRSSSFSTGSGDTKTVLCASPRAPPEPLRAPEPLRPPPPPPPPPVSKAYTVAAALAITASIGGVYFYRKLGDDVMQKLVPPKKKEERAITIERELPKSIPLSASSFPSEIEFLIVGGGTAAFAAMRAMRAQRPDAGVLVVGNELALPYMRPPLTKELWREPDLTKLAANPDTLTFKQWSGKRRNLSYEPAQYYSDVESMKDGARGAAVARGWTVERLDVQKHVAYLSNGHEQTSIKYKRCLLANGAVPRRIPALAEAGRAGRSLPLRTIEDVRRIAEALENERVKTVAVVGGNSYATELCSSLAERLRDSGRQIVQLTSEKAPLADILPEHLSRGLAIDLQEAGISLRTGVEIVHADVIGTKVHMKLKPTNQKEDFSGNTELVADLVVECVGTETDKEFADKSGLETHPELGGIVVNSELQAQTDVYVAGDAACFYSPLGRRRVTSHDHAVSSGRAAARNLGGSVEPYTHVEMTWADLAVHTQYEGIGIIDSKLPTVSVFSADAVKEIEHKRENYVETETQAGIQAGSLMQGEKQAGTDNQAEIEKQYKRGVVFYLNGRRVVGVLLWNLFNRVHLARQVLAQGEFDDLFEVAKLFSPQEEE